jgi:hypothetical protein
LSNVRKRPWPGAWRCSDPWRPPAGLAGAGALADGGKLRLRHGKADVDRIDLGDHHHAVGVRRREVVADIHLANADAARNRRLDRGVIKIEHRRADGGAIGGHGADELAHRGALGVHLLAGD